MPRLVGRMYSGAAFQLVDGTFLLQQRDDRPDIANPGKVSFFGGTALSEESADECLVRELVEELGVQIDWNLTRRVCEMWKIDRDGALVLMTIYVSTQISMALVSALTVTEGRAFVHRPGSASDALLSPVCRLFFQNWVWDVTSSAVCARLN